MGVRAGGRGWRGPAPVGLLLRGGAMSALAPIVERRAVAAASLEGILAEVLAGVLRTDGVPLDSHFFDELGADSLVMAQFCARVRKHGGLPSVSMKDVYAHPTIRSLAAAVADRAPAARSRAAGAPELP